MKKIFRERRSFFLLLVCQTLYSLVKSFSLRGIAHCCSLFESRPLNFYTFFELRISVNFAEILIFDFENFPIFDDFDNNY